MDGGWVGIPGPRFLQGVDVPGLRYSPRKVHTQEGTHQGRYTTWVGTPQERYTPGTDI